MVPSYLQRSKLQTANCSKLLPNPNPPPTNQNGKWLFPDNGEGGKLRTYPPYTTLATKTKMVKFKKRNINKKKQLRKVDNFNLSRDAGKATSSNLENRSISTAARDNAFKDDHSHEDDDEEEEGDNHALDTILAVGRRKKLLGNRNRGVDAANHFKATTTKSTDSKITNVDKALTAAVSAAQSKDLEERLKGTFSEGKLAGSNDMGGGNEDDEGGVLAKKHKRAMEEFIQQHLQANSNAVHDSNGITEMESYGSAAAAAAKASAARCGPTEDEKELFADLLQSASSDNVNPNAQRNPSSTSKEGDIGAGGAMMMGSGIAEVALPISERLKTLKATEKAAREREKARSDKSAIRYGVRGGNESPFSSTTADITIGSGHGAEGDINYDLPLNFASGPGKRKRQDRRDDTCTVSKTIVVPSPKIASSQNLESTSSATYYSASSAGGSVKRSDVSTLGQSYSHNFQLHQQDWIAQRRDERQSEIDDLTAQQKAMDKGASAQDIGGGGRMGFEMVRRVAKGEKVRPPVARGPNGESLRNEWDRKQGSHQRSNDDRVWKQFISSQRHRK